MSDEQPPLDPQLIEQTKQQIRMLVNEIAQLAKSELSPEEFYGEFLPRVVSALAAIGGAVWVTEAGGRLALGYQMNLHQTRLRDDEEGQLRHGRLLHRVLTSGEGGLIPPRSGAGEDDQEANPTDFLLVLAPLKAADETVGVVEIFQRPDTRPATQKGYLHFLSQMCERAGEFFKTHQLRHFTDRQTLWTQLEEFTRGVHASLHPRDTAYTIANDGRRLIECDRVSVAIRKGTKCVIEAVSGQDLFDKRSNTLRLLGKLATAVVASGEPIWYTGDTSNMAPQVEDAVQAYVDESHSKTVAVLPLQRPLPLDEAEEDPDKRPEPEAAVGALIVEQIEDARVPEKMLQRVGVVTQHSSTALANALEHNNLFLLPLWRVLGKARWLVKARTLPKTTLVAGGILAVVLFLTLYPKTLKMQAPGTLQPATRRNVYVAVDNSDVVEVLVELGDMVRKGQLLARLDNPDLNAAIEGLQGDLNATDKRIHTLDLTLASQSGGGAQKRIESLRLEGESSELKAKRKHLEKQLEHYKEKRSKLEVRSPIAGQVVTWDVKNLLSRDRPLRRGDTLMEIYDLQGPWHLEVEMPDKRMGHILQSQFEKNKDELKVEFILESEANVTHVGKIKRIDATAEVRGDEGNTVLIEVEISDEVKEKLLAGLPPGASLRPGSTVRAKVDCGSRSVGYVLFHDLIAFIQSKILFRWF